MITRTTKYTASDGTEHDSPQEAAAYDLQKALEPLMGLAVKDLFMGEPSSAELAEMARELARNPEALRDALNTYFEDLEAHPDVDDPANVFHDMVRHGIGIMRVDPAVVYKPAPLGDPEDPTTWAVVGASHAMPKDKDRYIEGTLPVDHPQYCRPFGTKED